MAEGLKKGKYASVTRSDLRSIKQSREVEKLGGGHTS
jgi:hypothetical protein